MAKDKAVTNEEYQGPGRATSALGKAAVNYIGGDIAGSAIGAAGAAVLLKNDTTLLHGLFNTRLASYFPSITSAKGKSVIAVTVIAGSVAALASGVIGLFKGWNNAKKGKAQFEESQEKLGRAGTIIEQQQAELIAAKHEIHTERARFTETIKSRAHTGGHVAAVEADQANSAEAAVAR